MLQVIQKVCIVGAGAIGCTLAARIAKSGRVVNVLARGQTLHALQRNGVVLHDLEGTHYQPVRAESDAAMLGVQDVVFICTKAQALTELMPSLKPLIGPDTTIVPMINGVPWWYFHCEQGRFEGQRIQSVDPDGTLTQFDVLEKILGSVVFITAEADEPGVVRSANPYLVILGEPNNRLSDRLEQVRLLMEQAGIEARSTDRIRDSVWTKVIANLTSNPMSVVTGATLQDLYGHTRLQSVVRKIFNEALATAAAYGARINLDPLSFMQMGEKMGAVRTSMLQDFNKGRPLELEAIGEAVIELATLQGLSMPVTKDILNLARYRAQQPM